MKSPQNMALFDEYAGKTFASLYEAFHKEIFVSVESLTGKTDLHIVDASGSPQTIEECEIAFFTVKWLLNTGYISAKSHQPEGFSEAVLTAKGLELLKYVPDSLKPSFGDQLLAACKKGSNDSIINITSSALTKGIGIAYHTAISAFS